MRRLDADRHRHRRRTGGVDARCGRRATAVRRRPSRVDPSRSMRERRGRTASVARDVDGAHVDALGRAVRDGAVADGEAGGDRVVAAHDLGPGDLAEVPVEARRRCRRTCRSGRDGRSRRWSGSCRAAAVRGGCRRSRRPRRRTTRRPVHWAPVPMSVTSPPITKLGRRPASARISISIEVVVVLPCVPATPSDRACAQIDASMPARREHGDADRAAPRRARCCRRGIARRRGDRIEAVHERSGRGRRARRRRRLGRGRAPDARAGRMPDTVWPISASARAIALMPGPADADDVQPARLPDRAGRPVRDARARRSGGIGERGRVVTMATMLRPPARSNWPRRRCGAPRPGADAVAPARSRAAGSPASAVDLGAAGSVESRRLGSITAPPAVGEPRDVVASGGPRPRPTTARGSPACR